MQENRHTKIVFEAEKNITFEVSEGTNGEIIIRASNVASNKTSHVELVDHYSKLYETPIIPEGYKHICGEWNSGFVIERQTDKSQFVWVPVGSLYPDGTLDGGKNFSEKFGRRNYQHDEFSDSGFCEALEGELLEQYESVKKYGGFYISRYDISKSSKGKPQSVKGVMPWVNIYFDDAKEIAAMMEENETVKSHLIFGAEYDSVLAWFVKSKAKNLKDVARDSAEWGNYINTERSLQKVLLTGSSEKWCVNGIYDLTGNVSVLTQEENNKRMGYRVVRGGNFHQFGDICPATFRTWITTYSSNLTTGFRVALWIK